MAKKTRLDKFLCDSLNMTRKEAKESVKKGKVVVNGEAITFFSLHKGCK